MGLRQHGVHQSSVPHTHTPRPLLRLLRRRRAPLTPASQRNARQRQPRAADNSKRQPRAALSQLQASHNLLVSCSPAARLTRTHSQLTQRLTVSLQAHPCHTTCYLPPHPSVREGRRFAAAIHTFSETRERARACSLVILHLAHDF